MTAVERGSVTPTPGRTRKVLSVLRGSRTIPTTRWTATRFWRPTPGSAVSLVFGLWIFGAGDALLLASGLGASPWSVFAQGVSIRTGISIGEATFAISCAVLLGWVPLRQRPGLGTVLNVILIAFAIDVTYNHLLRPSTFVAQLTMVMLGIVLIGIGSGFYLTSGHGPGPRDGLMTGLHRVTGRPVGVVRLFIEVTVVVIGWLLGGTIGIGTVLFAVLIGQSVALGLALVERLGRLP